MANCAICGKRFGLIFGSSKVSATDINTARGKGIDAPDDICPGCLTALYKRAQDKRTNAINEIKDMVVREVFSKTPTEAIFSKIQEASRPLALSYLYIKDIVCQAANEIAVRDMDDGLLSEERERQIFSLLGQYKIQADDIPANIRNLLLSGEVLRNLLNCNKSPSFSTNGLPFNFQKTELLIWAGTDIPIAIPKTTSKFVGSSIGGSVRIAKGLYLRGSDFEGRRVSETSIVPLGSAIVAITSKHIYYTTRGYATGDASKRIKHEKIVSIDPYSDAIVISTDYARNNIICFYFKDPRFFMNILQNAQNWA
ncbi:MAG: hypothetical protein FWD70_00830 [Desulfuromonadales bacterium]|nr:hypothetical protein [Desulfuromonadales bacterium]